MILKIVDSFLACEDPATVSEGYRLSCHAQYGAPSRRSSEDREYEVYSEGYLTCLCWPEVKSRSFSLWFRRNYIEKGAVVFPCSMRAQRKYLLEIRYDRAVEKILLTPPMTSRAECITNALSKIHPMLIEVLNRVRCSLLTKLIQRRPTITCYQ